MFRKTVLILCILCINCALFGMQIQVINNTGCKCRVDQRLGRFSCVAGVVPTDGGTAKYVPHHGSIELAAGQSIVMLLTQSSKQAETPVSSAGSLIFSVESGFFFKKSEFRFSTALIPDMDRSLYIPALVGRKTDPATTMLRGKNDFFVKKYMSPRQDRYILEICGKGIKPPVEADVSVSRLSPKTSRRDADTVPLLDK